jgi:uncharacterized protein YpmB
LMHIRKQTKKVIIIIIIIIIAISLTNSKFVKYSYLERK